ncbi:MAG TPA: DUF1800 domain-containing protein [Chryseolinea sp.]
MNDDPKTKHFLNRAAFGPAPGLKTPVNTPTWIKSASHNRPIDVIPAVDGTAMTPDQRSPKDAKTRRSKFLDELTQLNTTWISQMVLPETLWREKMTLFWHDHFACRVRSAFLSQQLNNTIRREALGSFGDLLKAVSKDPAMLQFLNNQQNKKNSPNENFAREVLELFTLGRGHYTEADIKNGARAFTGWAFNPKMDAFVFRPRVHDEGSKTFKGKTGNFSGDDILHILLEDRQTAQFITEKIWRYFVHEGPPDTDIVSSLAKDFFRSDYDIHKLMTTVFSSTWFYEQRFAGNRIKSPVELLAGMLTQTGGRFEDARAALFFQRALSQVLFQPPNVGGWPTGTAWIDSSSLTFRMTMPALIFKNLTTEYVPKDDGDANNATNKAATRNLNCTVDWASLAQQFTKASTDETLAVVEDYLLATPTTAANRKLVATQASRSTRDDDWMKQAFTAFMSLPEYQLS